VRCPVLWVEAEDTDAHRWAGEADEVARRRAVLKSVEVARVAEAGHMLHHDQPSVVARLIEEFARRVAGSAP
jgi:pimeloyl-ACP methyl ester carboxylesterase